MIPAYSFVCYVCGPSEDDQDYSVDQCEKDLRREDCGFSEYYHTCFRYHIENTNGTVQELRGCEGKMFCNKMKEICSDEEQMKEMKIKKCQAACCVDAGDTPCNMPTSATTASSSEMIMMMLAALCSFKLL